MIDSMIIKLIITLVINDIESLFIKLIISYIFHFSCGKLP